jgi:hypothetical protein
MNNGFNPILFSNAPANVQMQSQQPPFYFGGSQVIDALGFRPTVKPIKVAPKPRVIIKDTIKLN